ncbi:MAG TPA: alpha/beta hydrolase, partial [Lacipirellulaceae bacterium]|nr:alpha/beta hydrolase [Lacipirellulaceae bacterium]
MPAGRRFISVGLLLAIASNQARGVEPSSPPIVGQHLETAEQILGAAAATDPEGAGCRAWLRRKVVRDSDLKKYGLVLEDAWQQADASKPVVVLIHGFNSSPKQNTALFVPIHEAGFPCGTFAYPNDYFIRSSAQLLSSELKRFAVQYPGRKVILVCHSMGGLVARACIEDSLYDPGNVERLIMVAPPTHGTIIAHFAVGTDLWEHWLSRKEGWPWERVRDSIVDGLG